MEAWVERALKKWPNVPSLFGWLSLDRRGRWRIRGELISRPQIVDTLNRNYAADAHGRWYFQNGPQRGYLQLETAPLVLRVQDDDTLHTHNGLQVRMAAAAFLDEEGSLWLDTEHGPAQLDGEDLAWALARITLAADPVSEDALLTALAQPSGTQTSLALRLHDDRCLPLERLDQHQVPQRLGFVRDPQPLPGERAPAVPE